MWKYLKSPLMLQFGLFQFQDLFWKMQINSKYKYLSCVSHPLPSQGGLSGNREELARVLRGSRGPPVFTNPGGNSPELQVVQRPGTCARVGRVPVDCTLRSTLSAEAPQDTWSLSEASLSNLSWLLPSLVLSSLCMGSGTFWIPPGPSPIALPLHLGSG